MKIDNSNMQIVGIYLTTISASVMLNELFAGTHNNMWSYMR